MILEKHGITDLTQCKQCDIINVKVMELIVQSPKFKPDVRSFIEALTGDDETKLLKLDGDTSNKIVLTCINNHKFENNSDNKIINYRRKCSVCGDSGNDSQLLSGFECNECKSFICDDCIIVQKISQKINDNGHSDYVNVLVTAANEMVEYKNNKKLLSKVELRKCLHCLFMIDL